MESLTVVEKVSGAYRLAYHPLLYNTPSYLDTNNGLPQKHFYLVDKNERKVLGHIAFSLEEGEATSPYKAPFGGFELSESSDSMSFLFFQAEVSRRLKAIGVRYVKIQTAPVCYEPLVDMMVNDLVHAGYKEKKRRRNHAIRVDAKPLLEKVDAMEKRRIRKAIKGGLTFRFGKASELRDFYDFIRQHREAKGHQLSMDYDTLKEATRVNPEQYLLAGVYMDSQLIGASILIQVSSRVVYNFFPAHDMAFNSWSPVVYLLHEVYQWCQGQSIQWLDLGTSYLGNKPNKGLIAFKEHMGAQPFESVILRKTLSS